MPAGEERRGVEVGERGVGCQRSARFTCGKYHMRDLEMTQKRVEALQNSLATARTHACTHTHIRTPARTHARTRTHTIHTEGIDTSTRTDTRSNIPPKKEENKTKKPYSPKKEDDDKKKPKKPY